MIDSTFIDIESDPEASGASFELANLNVEAFLRELWASLNWKNQLDSALSCLEQMEK
jgi:hypothetical protein